MVDQVVSLRNREMNVLTTGGGVREELRVIYTVTQNDILLFPWRGNFMWVASDIKYSSPIEEKFYVGT